MRQSFQLHYEQDTITVKNQNELNIYHVRNQDKESVQVVINFILSFESGK